MHLTLRLIKPEDNRYLERLVIDTLLAYGFSGPGNASADPELQDLHATYQQPRNLYYVIADENDQPHGGGGLAQLKSTGTQENICEMQKLYIDTRIRGRGMGYKLITRLIDDARRLGYKKMYIETMHQLETAIHLYRKCGFVHLEKPLGNTGHTSCTVFMELTL